MAGCKCYSLLPMEALLKPAELPLGVLPCVAVENDSQLFLALVQHKYHREREREGEIGGVRSGLDIESTSHSHSLKERTRKSAASLCAGRWRASRRSSSSRRPRCS